MERKINMKFVNDVEEEEEEEEIKVINRRMSSVVLRKEQEDDLFRKCFFLSLFVFNNLFL